MASVLISPSRVRTPADVLPDFGGVLKVSRRDSISKLLRDAIIRGEVRPGQRLGESQVAKSLGVSQVSVREALQILESEGLVVKKANRGTYVTEFNREELAEAIDLRILLETRAALLAHKRLTAADEVLLRGLILKMDRLIEAGQMFELEMADLEFHSTIWKIANNTPLERLLRTLVYPLFAFLALTHLNELKDEPLDELGVVHSKIVDAIVGGSAEDIAHAIRNNAFFGRVNKYLDTNDDASNVSG